MTAIRLTIFLAFQTLDYNIYIETAGGFEEEIIEFYGMVHHITSIIN